ncbi:MAG: 30S ribosomal protein S6 [Deltaproteobacteria bacterium]|jgi:small subunit ribosomal protein S6|nr:30S ribosomal protein S6 [Deltaproteobacteria bacterium]
MTYRRYETLILLSPQLSPDQLSGMKEKIEGIIAKGEGQIVRIEERGRQKLAYPVRKELYGFYMLFDYRAQSALAAELERNLKIDEKVFKYMTLVLDKNFTAERHEALLASLADEASRKEKELNQLAEAKKADSSEEESPSDGEDADVGDFNEEAEVAAESSEPTETPQPQTADDSADAAN